MLFSSVRLFLWLTLLTGLIYPLLVTALSFGERAKGSFVYKDSKAVGSTLIAQKFSGNTYFWPRPSATKFNPLPSGGSNLSPTSALLKKQVEERTEALLKAHPDAKREDIPADLLFASGSGLDPHISKEAALFQMKRVIKARNWNFPEADKLVLQLIEKAEEGPLFGFLGKSYVNVLKLNLKLDSHEQENRKEGDS